MKKSKYYQILLTLTIFFNLGCDKESINRFAGIFGQYYIHGFTITSILLVLMFVLYWKKISWPVIAWSIAWGAGIYLRFIR
ncbi:hypothetical protein [Aquiflexum sp.]|uniref:hypothetical protein n=1 Tax=Aquiflexum sp. TaxID=1872584 RepID=UPI00359387CF